MNEYLEFLEKKRHLSGQFGFSPVYMPEFLFDYQRHIVTHAIQKGRCAVYADTGLGKTAMQLVIAQNIVQKTNRRVIILTPLAVAFQFILEAGKIGIDSIQYSKDGKFTSDIVITNYERLDKFNPLDFEGVVLDESSILKNFDGAIKGAVTAFMKKTKYRFLFTATPSPNDYIELGTSSEALGYLGYMEMLGRFFANNENNIRPQEIASKWYLKPHATDDFFKWVSSWSISMRKPSDLGFDDSRHVLPNLHLKYNAVHNEKNLIVDGQIQLFNQVAKTMSEVRAEQQATVTKRCERAVELASAVDCSVYWCNFNDEGDLLDQMDKDAVQIKGSLSLDKKEEILLAFASGEIKKLITKPKMTAFGLNWQHCNHTVYFPTWSYEQYYQAIRRFWRFGQQRDVTCELVYSDGQKRVIDALLMKTERAKELFEKLNSTLNQGKEIITAEKFTKEIQTPTFI